MVMETKIEAVNQITESFSNADMGHGSSCYGLIPHAFWLYCDKVVFCIKFITMAITIKNIPVLEGATAENFVRSVDKNVSKTTPRLSVTAKKRLQKVLEKSRSFRFD